MTRSPGEQPPVVAPTKDSDGTGHNENTSPTPKPLSLHTVSSEDAAEALEFGVNARNVAAVRRLVAETAYSNESVLVYQTRVGECHRLKLNYITRDADEDPNLQFCRMIRDAHISCERGARDHVAAFVRLPFPADEYDGVSVGSGGGCDPVPDRYRNGSESS
ncbi:MULTISPECIES: hypothetical protein [unclassified Haloarcula]|uniref:hypothetical protein n=1 Tax=unclassified Haloarcula TaxID=2624677 RepID=UPI0012489573|nr:MULTISPECIES: hypothetical protein [unclassified Haloarcula]